MRKLPDHLTVKAGHDRFPFRLRDPTGMFTGSPYDGLEQGITALGRRGRNAGKGICVMISPRSRAVHGRALRGSSPLAPDVVSSAETSHREATSHGEAADGRPDAEAHTANR